MKNLGKGMCLSVCVCVHVCAHTHKHIHLSEYGYINACVCGWRQADNLTDVPQALLICLLLLASTGITVCPVVWHGFSETVVQSLQAFYCLSFIILDLRTQDSLGKSEHIPCKLPMLETQSTDLHIVFEGGTVGWQQGHEGHSVPSKKLPCTHCSQHLLP